MWNEIAASGRPVVLYGTGNAAERIMDELNKRNIEIAGFFANDDFVRGQSFHGFPVMKYGEAKERFGDMTVLLCFGSHLPDVIDRIKQIAAEQDLYAPDLPIAGEGLFTREYAAAHSSDIAEISALLADDESRRVLDCVCEYKQSGRIEHLFACESPDEESTKLLGLTDHERYVDLGAYTGDTVRSFLGAVSGYDVIYAVEPDPRNFRKLSENCAGLRNCRLINMAVSDAPGEMIFHKNSGRGSAKSGRGISIPCDSLDNMLEGRPVSFIKMDLEGQEPFAIDGAGETIASCKPKLLISAYHRTDDLWVLPKKILGINPDYRVYLRHSPCLPAWEINYYFV